MIPLSYAQHRLWFGSRVDPLGWTFNLPLVLRLDGQLDQAALTAALADLADRHESLRTIFPEVGGQPQQKILPAADVLEITGPEFSIADAERHVFDLTRDTPLRAWLVPSGTNSHVLVLVLHHIAGDGWSMAPLARDLAQAYEARVAGVAPSWEPLPVQYADYAVWQRELLGDPDDAGSLFAEQLAHWSQALEGLPDELALPYDRPRSAATSRSGGGVVPMRCDATLHSGLLELARSCGATLFMVVHAAVAALYARLGFGTDIPLGSVVAGRTDEALDDLIGFFVNTLVLRADASGDPSFRELLGRVRDADLGAYANQDLPFDRLVEALNPTRTGGRHPLFQTSLALQKSARLDLRLPGIRAQVIEQQNVASQFDLSFILNDHYAADGMPAGLTGHLIYQPELFDAETVQGLATRLFLLLSAAASQPDTPLSQLQILGASEFDTIVHRWNDTARPLPAATLAELFAAQAARTPDAPAVSDATQTLTYAELDQRANHLAYRLAKAGAGPDVPVAILQQRSADLLVSMLGVLKAGAAFVPLPPAAPASRLSQIIAQASPPILITDLDHDLPIGCVISPGDPGRSPEPPQTATPAGPASLAYIMFTSGSTGIPKGVATTNECVVAFALDRFWQASAPTRILFHAPHAFDASTLEIWPALLSGSTVVVAPPGDVDLTDLDKLITRDRQTRIHATAGLFQVLGDGAAGCFEGVGEVYTGGDVVSAIAVRRVLERCPGLRVWALYGPTEITMCATGSPMDTPADVPNLVPIGRPMDNTRAYVLDARLQPVPPGYSGELYIAGSGLARGYLGRPDLTCERFVADPFGLAGTRMYRTGDLASWRTDGVLEFIGRTDGQVKIRGFRVEPGEIEAVLAVHPSVTHAVVVPDGDALIGYLTPASADIAAVRAHVAATLPEYMVPRAFVALAELPLTPNGKLDWDALPKPAAQVTLARPRTPLEEILARLVADVLDLPAVGVHDSFFDLGGHSLLAARLVNRIRAALGKRIGLPALFEAPTVVGIARLLGRETGAGGPVLAPRERPALVPLAPAQRRLWFSARIDPLGWTYNLSLILRVSGAVSADGLQAALGDVLARHEALRTVFPEAGGQPCQQVLPAGQAADGVLTIERVAPDGLDEAAQRATRHRFDLTADIPIRTWLLSADHAGVSGGSSLRASTAGTHLIVIVLHHIAGDGWSMAPLARDLAQAYAARATGGTPPSWEPLPVQYADYALWQHEVLGDESDPESALAGQLAYWQQTLADLPVELALPYDRARPPVSDFRGATVPVRLAGSLHAGLLELARRGGVTLFMVLHAAVAALLTRLGAGTDIPLGSGVAGRTDEALDDLVGFFVNTIVLRVDTGGDPTFRELLRRVRDTDLAAYAHQDLPFDRLVEALNPARSLARHPLFQASVMVHGTSAPGFDFAGAPAQIDDTAAAAAQFDLSFNVADHYDADGSPAGVFGDVVYRTELFDASTVADLAHRFELLLEAAVAEPEAPLSRLAILTQAEQDTILREWNDTTTPLPAATLAQLFAAQAARTPDAPAISDATQTLTYAELDQRANHLARRLAANGAGPDVPVAILQDRSAEVVVSIIAVLKAGAAYLPLPTSAPDSRLAQIIAQARPPILITDRRQKASEFGVPCVIAQEDQRSQTPPPGATQARPENLAYIMYTSGSTGVPKGVAVTNEGVVAMSLDRNRPVGSLRRFLWHAPHSFDASMFEIWPALLAGGEVVALPPGDLDVDQVRRTIRDREITSALFTPALFDLMADEAVAELGSLRQVWTGGDKVSPRSVQRVLDACPDTVVTAGYGPTETTVIATWHELPAGQPVPARVPIGRPMDNTAIYLLDSHLRPVPAGVAAEVYIAGPRIARGYLAAPGLTAERFVAGPYGPAGGRMYRTGDIAKWRADGTLDYVDRADSQVKIRGYRVEPGEIQAVLASHPSVARAAVIARPDQAGGQRLIAYLVPAEVPVSDVQAHAARRLPGYMLPSAYLTLDELPLTVNGKLDKKALPEPDLRAANSRKPRNQEESVLAGLFAEVLGVDQVGIDDNFFDLGGHSLLATRLVNRIAAALGPALSITSLFEAPTVAGLAVLLGEADPGARADDLAPVLRLRAGDGGPTLFCIHPGGGMSWCYSGLLRHLDPETGIYGLQAVGLDGEAELPGSIEQMAADYLAKIRELQPHGPYHLLGWSFGGVIAHAIATGLQADGERVALLAILDGYPATGAQGELTDAEIRSLAFDKNGSAPGDLPEATVTALLRVIANNDRLLRGYEPAKYVGDVLLFQAGREGEAEERAELWRPYLAGSISAYVINSTHAHMTGADALSLIGPAIAADLDCRQEN
jgi:amino acid adenylation domain-containing protein